MITITIPNDVAAHMLDYLEFNSDNNCSSGPLPPSDEYDMFREKLRLALDSQEGNCPQKNDTFTQN